MDKLNLRKINKLTKSRFFTVNSLVKFNIDIDFLQPKSESDILKSIKSHVLPHAIEVLQTGAVPFLNPTFATVASKKNDREIDKDSLLEFINSNCYYSINEVDVNSDHVNLTCPMEMIFNNFCALTDDQLENIGNNVKFKTLMGEYEVEKIL